MAIFTVYCVGAVIIGILGLIVYGINQALPDKERLGVSCVEYVILFAATWPITLALVILLSLGKLPILLGNHIGKTICRKKAKKDFKELINNNKKGES